MPTTMNNNANHEFPFKLHKMLQDAHIEGNEHIVSWTSNGTAFRVHHRENFVSQILPRYFNNIKIRSFLRQLNLYRFRRETSKSSPTYGAYSHKHFIRGDVTLCSCVKRAPSSKQAEGSSFVPLPPTAVSADHTPERPNHNQGGDYRLPSTGGMTEHISSWTKIHESVLRSHDQGIPLDDCLKSNELFQPFPFDGRHQCKSHLLSSIPDSDWRFLNEIVQDLTASFE